MPRPVVCPAGLGHPVPQHLTAPAPRKRLKKKKKKEQAAIHERAFTNSWLLTASVYASQFCSSWASSSF